MANIDKSRQYISREKTPRWLEERTYEKQIKNEYDPQLEKRAKSIFKTTSIRLGRLKQRSLAPLLKIFCFVFYFPVNSGISQLRNPPIGKTIHQYLAIKSQPFFTGSFFLFLFFIPIVIGYFLSNFFEIKTFKK